MPRSRWLVVFLTLTVVLSGCSMLGGGNPTAPTTQPTATEEAVSTPVPTATPTVERPVPTASETETSTPAESTPTDAQQTETPTPEPTPTPEEIDNPWGRETITLSVIPHQNAEPGQYQEIGQEVASFWGQNLQSIAGYEGDVVYTGTSADADIIIRPRPTISSCNGEESSTSFFWCAERVNGRTNPGTLNVTVASRYTVADQETIYRAAVADALMVQPESEPALEYSSSFRPELADPWPGRDNLTVAIRAPRTGRDYASMVRNATAYWEASGADYRRYTANMTVRPDARNPDILIDFVEDVGACGTHDTAEDTIGCASVLSGGSVADRPEVVRIERGYTTSTTTELIQHELGHIYGLGHDTPPSVMAPTQATVELPETNATARDNPFASDGIDVYVDYASFDFSNSAVEEQAVETIAYFDSHGGEYAPDTSIEVVDSRSEAEIIVRGYDDSNFPCQVDGGSCYLVQGNNSDADDSFESYTSMEIAINVGGANRVGYHIGYHMAGVFAQYERPPDLNSGNDDRTNWWR